MRGVLITLPLLWPLSVDAAEVVKFFYDQSGGGPLTCNGVPAVGNQVPFECMFSDTGKLVISLGSWGGNGSAVLVRDDSATRINGFCGGSVNRDDNFSDAYQLNITCLGADAPPPPATGERIVDEWYSDLPWNQKLSTKDSNLINVPFVLPFAALPSAYREWGECAKDEARCMLRYGIVNVMSMHRTDSRYKEGEALTAQDCQDDQCVEVRLDIHRFHTHTANAEGYAGDEIRNTRKTYINHQGKSLTVPSLGFAVTEATIFAPWRPWYTGHYCAVYEDNIADSVCYEDYFTTQLIAPTPFERSWLKDAPAFFWPRGTEAGFNTFCKSGQEVCSMYLGKVDWLHNATEPKAVACKQPSPAASLDTCQQEVLARTQRLDEQFNVAITSFTDEGRYPWNESAIENLAADLHYNPFIGFYALQRDQINAKTGLFMFKSPHYALPKECTKTNYLGARQGKGADIQRLEDCVLNFEIHTSGFHELWKELYGGALPLPDDAVKDISQAIPGTDANQYGRTMFMYGGVPEQHIPVSFKVIDEVRDIDHRVLVPAMSIYDKVHNASIYTQYLPMVNPGDLTLNSKDYTDDFWHAFFMSNHMNQTPDHFIRGIRGRTLWHNEYRSNLMYKAAVDVDSGGKRSIDGTKFENIIEHVDFPAGFQVDSVKRLAPFHGNTCDSCHVRNGSGVPLMPNGKLPRLHEAHGMKADFQIRRDYTYSNPELPSMKMVFFDLRDKNDISTDCDDNNALAEEFEFHPPLAAPTWSGYYNNKIMNFYGNSFHLYQNQNKLTYNMEYQDICGNEGFEVVDKTLRKPSDDGLSTCQAAAGKRSTYPPKSVKVNLKKQFKTDDVCRLLVPTPAGFDPKQWPAGCDEVSGAAIETAIANHEIGFMHLMGRRLGNTPMIEMMPDRIIVATREQQAREQQALDESVTSAPGCISLAPGTRAGSDGGFNYRSCGTGVLGNDRTDCYIGRWGWIGDRASLEDQIANAAHMEMNISSVNSYDALDFEKQDDDDPLAKHDNDKLVRYDHTLCGPADESCQELLPNSDITEQEIRDMATYQRWIGIPNRSEYQVSSAKVQQGERIFNELKCSSCHVIKKITFDFNDNMLPDEERKHLQKLQIRAANNSETDYPFISYLGTDLLMHDMGYLSQVAAAPAGVKIRDKKGKVKLEYRNYVQKIRTPALKGLRFNRFVTDSNHNTLDATSPLKNNFTPGCDFLLHDGRACDAIEAAYLHDGPAIKNLRTIEALNNLEPEALEQLRAFLYSL